MITGRSRNHLDKLGENEKIIEDTDSVVLRTAQIKNIPLFMESLGCSCAGIMCGIA